MLTIKDTLTDLEWLSIVYFFSLNGIYLLLLLSAALQASVHIRQIRSETRWRILGSRVAPGITILVPSYNEEATITHSLRAILALFYPKLEVVVVNDGSKDRTMAVLIQEFDLVPVYPIYHQQLPTKEIKALYRSPLYPNLVVVDKLNGGKADALNAAINLATGDLVCAIDADTLVEPDALQRLVRPFLGHDEVVAAGGTIRVVNGSVVKGGRVLDSRVPRNPLSAMQVLEYLRAFLVGRLGWNELGGNLIISGAFGLFRRESLLQVGGYCDETVGEDMEVVLKLRRHGYETGRPHRVEFIPDPIAWTEAPSTLRDLGRQRSRWHRGLADVLWRHRRVFFNPRYGAMGLFTFPYFLFGELLAPVWEVAGLVVTGLGLLAGVLDRYMVVALLMVVYGFGVTLNVMAVALEEFAFHRYKRIWDRLALIGLATAENIGYRQLTTYWRLRGLWQFLRGRKDWGAMERTGFKPK